MNPNSRQRFRACGELEGGTYPICPGLGSSPLDTSEMTYRSADQFQPKRHGRIYGEDELVAVSLYSVRVTSVDVSTVSAHPRCCSVDSATDEAYCLHSVKEWTQAEPGARFAGVCSGLYNL